MMLQLFKALARLPQFVPLENRSMKASGYAEALFGCDSIRGQYAGQKWTRDGHKSAHRYVHLLFEAHALSVLENAKSSKAVLW